MKSQLFTVNNCEVNTLKRIGTLSLSFRAAEKIQEVAIISLGINVLLL